MSNLLKILRLKKVITKTKEISKSKPLIDDKTKEILDENLPTLNKVHAILLNCINLNKKQKLEFVEIIQRDLKGINNTLE